MSTTAPDPAPPSAGELQLRLAEERTALAVERTYAGWLRTGMGAMGIALATHALFHDSGADWLPRGVASLFLLIALVIFATGDRQARRLLDQLGREHSLPLRLRFTRLSVLFLVATLAVGLLIWRG